jgi:RNA polymerase sigma-70 factor (ECF subfamily)
MERSDQELLDALGAGDREALAELVERHAPAVYRFAAKMCREPEDAKDVLQETLLSAARGLGDFRGDSSLTTWFYAVARSFCIKKRRKSKFAPAETVSLERSGEVVHVPDKSLPPDEVAAGRELGAALDRAISALEPDYREVLLLRDVEGLTAPEVAKVVGASVAAVKSRLHRARAEVRARLEPQPLATQMAPACQDVVLMFSRFLEDEIGTAECEKMSEHIKVCERCRATCDSFEHTLNLCRAARGRQVPSEVQIQVRQALRALGAEAPAK